MTHKFPKWLPAEVKEHTKRLIEIGGLDNAEPLLMRLVTHLEMESVWDGLSRETKNSQKLIDYLEFVRLHSTLQGNVTDPIKIPSDKKQRVAFKKVVDLSLHMIKVLGDLSPSGDPQQGWSLLESALRRSELHEVNQTSKDSFLAIKRLQNNLHDIQQKESVISHFETIAEASQIASTAPDTALPKRRNSERAKCNQLIMDLRLYLKRESLGIADTLIAATVNTAFNSPDGGISVDDVRKLKI